MAMQVLIFLFFVGCAASQDLIVDLHGNCMVCPPGSYQNVPGLDTCIACPSGTMSNSTDRASCVQCSPGMESGPRTKEFGIKRNESVDAAEQYLSGSTTCEPCVAGKFRKYANLSTCELCPSGTFSGAGASNCSRCPTNMYSSREDRPHKYMWCPNGYYSTDSSVEELTCKVCSSCMGNESNHTACTNFQDAVCNSSLGSVSSGYSSPASANSSLQNLLFETCVFCPAGTISMYQTGSSSCVTCPVGFGNNGGGTACEECTAGTYSLHGICTECPNLTFQDKPGQPSCIAYTACSPGYRASGSDSKITDRKASDCVFCSCTTPNTFVSGELCAGNVVPRIDFDETEHCSSCTDCLDNNDSFWNGTTCRGNTLFDTQLPCAACGECAIGSFENRRCIRGDSLGCLVCPTCAEATKTICSTVAAGRLNSYNQNTDKCVSCDSCGPNFFISNNCGSYNASMPNCTRCTNDPCEEGTYRRNCTGTMEHDDSVCVPCSACTGNSRFVGNCTSGSTQHQCIQCNGCESLSIQFPYGAYVSSTCQESATQAACKGCQPCTSGFYVKSNCTGQSTVNQSTCAPSTSCLPGLFCFVVSFCVFIVVKNSYCY